MKLKIEPWLVLFSLFFSLTNSQAADVKIAFGEKIPPFCFPETNSGIEIDIFREALAFKGHKLIPTYFPFARITWALKNKKVDAAMTDLGENLESSTGAFYGDTAVVYDNVFISLKEKNLSIKKPADLKDLKIVSFQGAVKRYPEWLKQAHEKKKLREENNQDQQVLQLHSNRTDIILIDVNIYRYFHNKLKKSGLIMGKEITEHHFVKIDPADYRPVFHDKKIRDDFNLGLKYLKDSGRYKAIYDKYLNEGILENSSFDVFESNNSLSYIIHY